MKLRYCSILLFLMLSSFLPQAQAGWVNFEFNQLCNVYWDHTGPIKLGSFDKSGLDIQDGGNTSVDVPLDIFCLGRPDKLKRSDAYFRMVVTGVLPASFRRDNELVLTNVAPAERNEHYQIKANLCAGQATGEISQLCVGTIGTPTDYVMPGGGDQKEFVDSMLAPSTGEAIAMNQKFCSEHPDECDYSFIGAHIGKWEHPYRMRAHLIIPQQRQIAPGNYSGNYAIKLDGKLQGEELLKIPLVGLNINNVQQALEFRLSVTSACEVTPPADVTLPEQMFSGQSESQVATAQIRCTYGTPYTVIFRGKNTDSSGTEYLSNDIGLDHKIPYQITTMDGNQWNPLGEKFTGTSEKQPIRFVVKTLPSTNQRAGDYEDTVTMTINYTDGT